MPEEKLFTVKSMVRRTSLLPTGEFVDVYEITFETKSGVVSTVEIPIEKFTKEIAEREITREAEKIEGVMEL